jgi:hypothetical protein
MIFLSVIGTIYFLGGWVSPVALENIGLSGFGEVFFIIKVLLLFMFFIWIRATLPRYRYDQLMELAWKSLLPFLFSFFLCLISFVCFWKSLFFQFSVLLVIMLNLIHFIFYFFSTISIIEQYTSYDYFLKNHIFVFSIKNIVHDSGPFFILHPIKELLQIYINTFCNNNKYYNFFYFTNQTAFYKSIIPIVTIPDVEDETVMKIHKPFFSLMNQELIITKQIYNFHYLLNKLTNYYQKWTLLDLEFEEINERIELINVMTNFNINGRRISNMEGFMKQYQTNVTYLLNKKLQTTYGSSIQNVSTSILHIAGIVQEEKWSPVFVKICDAYKEEIERILSIRKQKFELIISIFEFVLRPLIAPFNFISCIYEYSYYQVLQIFPWDLQKSPYGSIIKDQAIINAKYI